MSETLREAWMTGELEAELKLIARGGAITCEQAQEFAQKHQIEITGMKPFVELIGLRISNCRGLCA